ncbi:MAG: PAS domain-containing sensor histidine kinase [Sphingomonadales bacterium RIFCSPHIGHO2_01_FULL_65_20]|jgi:two-component system nitrogen regulation sensor histidine kinase NtrY|uniref:histidine kinase n=2 Tax=Sphingomonadaceae TaxID=41297 RepID=A0A7V8RGD5_9SPHN|nr:HAMP domain-containing protein [Sphingomonas ursincola]MBA4779245.1 HAMP domain-containing protein [Blastomonas sp.]MBY0618704.1 HAMP domain-containing protein [Sphingomonas ursincola]OHC91807.1 MAG: PAS domain-containing sensor histidine kinase [Sphingomonadales bacterium RIFCSPHIGHO2_01_FULL_65_20]
MPASAAQLPNRKSRLTRRFAVMMRRGSLFPALEIGCVLLLIGMLGLSWWLVSSYQGREAMVPAPVTATLLVANLVPAMALLALIGRRVAISRANASGEQGTGQLHVRFVALFSLISSIPMLLVVVITSLLFQYGVEFWFSERARTMLENANDLARGYYEEGRRDVSAETVAMASDLRQYLQQTRIDSPEFAEAYVFQVAGRKMNESAIVEVGSDGVLRTAAIVDPDNRTSSDRVSPAIIRQLDKGETAVVSAEADRIEVVTPIDRQAKIYLYVARASNQLALSQWERAQTVLTDYKALFSRSQNLQVQFNIALFFVSLLLVAVALWAALKFADRMVRPLTDMAGAARDISTGNFAIRVDTANRTDEVGVLGRAFNRMASRLAEQTSALIRANSQLDDRRAFTEAVLESVSAGVISVDPMGVVRLMNSTAQRLLQTEVAHCLGCTLSDIAPPFARLVGEGTEKAVIQYSRENDLLTLAVRVVREPYGIVITFEDITQQLVDQRQAAWSDVARRIAHEIKNPLTPIQLAAERLKRRYASKVSEDDATFGQLTDTIVRQVGDLRNMVDEFSSFARMPKPVFREENFFDLVRQAIFLQEVAHPAIRFAAEGAHEGSDLCCDRRQIGQAVTNILKNAVEAIEARQQIEQDYSGAVTATVFRQEPYLVLTLDDNGIGLPADRDRIVEPYMTTREKGTGLGLAIVKKIVEEHYGELSFEPNDQGGTRVTIRMDTVLLQAGALQDPASDDQRSGTEKMTTMTSRPARARAELSPTAQDKESN